MSDMIPESNPAVVSTGLEWQDQNGLTMHSIASWYQHDPLVVYIQFPKTVHGPIEWVMSRTLFHDALLNGKSGDGDVKFLASLEDDTLVMFLFSPDGEAGLMASLEPITRFLEATYRIVGEGEEDVSSDVEAAIALIMEGSE